MTVSGLLKLGLSALVVAALGWVVTFVVGTFSTQPDSVENLTPAWTAAGATPLGETTTVSVSPGQTLVAFLVGTDLQSTAGTTTGTCSASAAGRSIDLAWPVQINPELSGILDDGEQVVAVAGWANPGRDPVSVDITCTSSDSTVEHFVALPARTGAVQRNPWFQPWGWLALGTTGILAVAIALARSR